jgi:hypothetical protein
VRMHAQADDSAPAASRHAAGAARPAPVDDPGRASDLTLAASDQPASMPRRREAPQATEAATAPTRRNP